MKLIDATDDQLAALAEAGTAGVDRIGEARQSGALAITPTVEASRLLAQLKDMRDELRSAKQELDGTTQIISGLQGKLARAEAELAEKTAALRLTDPDDVAGRLADARITGRQEAIAACEGELRGLRSENARLKSENDELRASKKKLREALDRAREGR